MVERARSSGCVVTSGRRGAAAVVTGREVVVADVVGGATLVALGVEAEAVLVEAVVEVRGASVRTTATVVVDRLVEPPLPARIAVTMPAPQIAATIAAAPARRLRSRRRILGIVADDRADDSGQLLASSGQRVGVLPLRAPVPHSDW
jgi:hypothetical protein